MRTIWFYLVLATTLVLAACSGGSVPFSSVPAGTPVVETASSGSAKRIAVAANDFIQTHFIEYSTRGLYGASPGNECVATVQAILAQAAIPYVGGTDGNGEPVVNVDRFRSALVADKAHWVRVGKDRATKLGEPGDIWVQGDGAAGNHAGQNHVGICQDRGCNHIVSNSSQHGSFTWSGTPHFYVAYYHARGYPYLDGAIYHHR